MITQFCIKSLLVFLNVFAYYVSLYVGEKGYGCNMAYSSKSGVSYDIYTAHAQLAPPTWKKAGTCNHSFWKKKKKKLSKLFLWNIV